jgi:hypothetical protein
VTTPTSFRSDDEDEDEDEELPAVSSTYVPFRPFLAHIDEANEALLTKCYVALVCLIVTLIILM